MRRPIGLLLGLLLAAAGFGAHVAPVTAAATFTVNRTGDAADLNLANAACDVSSNSGTQCTLRAAIQEANDTPGADTIRFNITSTSKVIAPATPLPAITDVVTINGYSQSGASPNTRTTGNNATLKIVLDGINAGDDANGLVVEDPGQSVVRGLVIQRWDGAGILLNSSLNLVAGNFIGTNPAGNAARGNGIGIAIDSMVENTIGGTTPGARNLISGNQTGVNIFGSADCLILFNYIGTDKAGNAAIPNVAGIHIELGGAHDIGQPGAGNLISGNLQSGIGFDESGGNIVRSNLIGTNAAGTADLGNGSNGIYIFGAQNNEIGGLAANQRNVVSGNHNRGIVLAGTDDNRVLGNRIGTKSDGTGDLGNDTGGIWLLSANENLIGSADAGSTNLISGNGGPGVEIGGSAPTDNVIRNNAIRLNDAAGVFVGSGTSNAITANVVFSNVDDGILVGGSARGVRMTANQIFSNGGLGIDLMGGTENGAGITANDQDDPDGGANNRQNFPIITSAVRSNQSGLTTIAATLNSNPSTEFRIELFIAAADPSGSGEGQVLLAAKNITTTAAGDRAFSFQLGLAAGTVVTMTATAVTAGHTSEFAANRTVVTGP